MTTVHALEQERQAILDRMQMRRESYRRMLSDGDDFRALPPRIDGHANGHADGHLDAHADLGEQAARRLAIADSADGAVADNTVYTYRRVPDTFPRTRLMQTVSQHPVLVALGVAALFAIGPRRIARTVASSGALMGAVAASQSRMDLIGRVLNLAGTYAQRRGR